MSKKIEKQELESLQEKVNKINSLQVQIGGLEAQKHELLHAISAANTELGVIQSELSEKYGDVSVDMKTGEIKQNEPNKKD